MASVSATIRVKVLFFGSMRELCGISEECPQITEGATIHDLFGEYGARFPKLLSFRDSLVAACNQEFAAWNTKLRDGDEVAFLPPVSGG